LGWTSAADFLFVAQDAKDLVFPLSSRVAGKLRPGSVVIDAAHREQEQPRILVLAEETLGVAAGN